ncbi:MAG: winged helix-turn-helix domain-containing protein [Nitrospiraceae bacterium]|nr:winged helix-turn-helix domain-containing protein [Nitrospiraceae bacterium]
MKYFFIYQMLKKLFSSAIRAEVLSLLLNSPEDRFYMREISRLLEKNPSAVKRELDSLEKIGVVKSEKVANLKYFQADESSPLYYELKNLITKSLGLAGSLKALLRGSAVCAFIFGPYAEGRDVKTVDLMVVTNGDIEEKAIRKTAKNFGYKVTLTRMSEQEYRQRKKSRDRALQKILSDRRIPLLGRA